MTFFSETKMLSRVVLRPTRLIILLAAIVCLPHHSAYADECEELSETAPAIFDKSSSNMDRLQVLKAKMLIVEGDKNAITAIIEEVLLILNEQYILSRKILAMVEVLKSVDDRCGISEEVIKQHVTVHGEFVEGGPRLIQRMKDMLEVYRAP